jgi:hypothetical protein
MGERNYQHITWSDRLIGFVNFLNEQDVEDYSKEVDFNAQRVWVNKLWSDSKNEETFEAQCTRENLKKLCFVVYRVAGNGVVLNHFPDWSYVVTQFHLFVMDVEFKKLAWPQQQSDGMHIEPSMPADGRAMVGDTADLLAELVRRV